MIGRLSEVVIDCPDPHSLARFYSELLGMPVAREDDDWVVIGDQRPERIAFQLAPDHQPPRWPDPNYPQQFHLDVLVDDITEAEPKVLALGASRLPGGSAMDGLSEEQGSGFRVYADPAGHPFCLVWD